jgi:predicted dinucleotide-binding enzyme
MKIGVLGAGHMGATVAELFIQAGHTVAISNAHGPASLQSLVEQLGPQAQATTDADTVRYGEIVFIALPWTKLDQLPDKYLFEQKITIDATNPYDSHGLVDLHNSTSSEEVLKHIPGARLVKAFNTIYFETLRAGSHPELPLEGERLVLFLASDDSEAKEVVGRLIEEIGFSSVDTGFLHEGGKRQEPTSPLYNVPMTFNDAKQRLADLP